MNNFLYLVFNTDSHQGWSSLRFGYFVWLLMECYKINTKDLREDRTEQDRWVYAFVERSFHVHGWGSVTIEGYKEGRKKSRFKGKMVNLLWDKLDFQTNVQEDIRYLKSRHSRWALGSWISENPLNCITLCKKFIKIQWENGRDTVMPQDQWELKTPIA